jgi:hypothetical protein
MVSLCVLGRETPKAALADQSKPGDWAWQHFFNVMMPRDRLKLFG